MTGTKPKIAFFASGSGTNFGNLVERIQSGQLHAEAALLVCDKPGAGVLERSLRFGIRAEVLDRKKYESRAAFEAAVMDAVDERRADWLVLCGFMRILSEAFVLRYWGRIINIHPSFLPAFPGAHAIQDAFEAGVRETGVTVHFVDTGVDSGPVILQKKLPVHPGESLEKLESRVHALEYELYPEALARVLDGAARMAKAPPRQS